VQNLSVDSLDEDYMREALAVAAAGLDAGELPIGAVVIVDGDIVGSAYTQERTQRRLLVHAELLALDQADHALGISRRRAALYSTLEPCLGCLGAAMTVRVGTVVYGLHSPGDGATAIVTTWDTDRATQDIPAYRLPAVRGGILADESAELFTRYVEHADPTNPMTSWARTLIDHWKTN
jgi:tRNA(adenine34) deaminase